MLDLTCRRAGLENGIDILELGCGWGSLTLWMAEKYPDARITAVSNSRPQREFILSEGERKARQSRVGERGVRGRPRARVERLHRTWTKDRDYLAPPAIGTLAELDPSQLVHPPIGSGNRVCPDRHAAGVGQDIWFR